VAGSGPFVAALLVAFPGAERGYGATPDERRSELLKTCARERYEFTPRVRRAFLDYAKARARADLEEKGRSLPREFLSWIDGDPVVEKSVYCGHNRPSEVLLHLYSQRLDLGRARFEKYRQLALAAAIVNAKRAIEADVTPRGTLKLEIGGDPRRAVDTKERGRKLDMNDHIVNFLNDNTIEEEVVVGYKDAPAELKYDSRGIAIPAPKRKGKAKKVPVVEKRRRSLYAADVLASRELQTRFNAYMKSKGHPTDIDCGDRVVHWKSRDAVRGQQRSRIAEAYKLFKEAYEAKGLLPAERDPIPSPAELCLFLIRNDEHSFPPELQAKRKWPLFPLTSPWPVLTLLVDDPQSLREREERWIAYRDDGEFKKYGEYIGGIAQQFDMQSARRLKPLSFTYRTIQMMLKDGGVCGTMGAVSARSHNTLGIPASQAIQPGHCAMVAFQYDAKKKLYSCKGQQYATGGDEKTTPFVRWFFGDEAKESRRRTGFGVPPNPRKPMVYHQSIAWAVNHGMQSFLDSMMVHCVYELLDEPARKGPGRALLASGLAINPYSFLLTDAAQAAAATPQEQIAFWRTFQARLEAAGDKSGCPVDGLYAKTVKKKVFASIAKLPVPKDRRAAAEVFEFLKEEKCDAPAALVAYRLAVEGLPALLSSVEKEFKEHLVSSRAKISDANDTACKSMAAAIKATAAAVSDRDGRKKWALGLWKQADGREKYFGRWGRVATDPAVSLLAKEAGQRMPRDAELMQSLLDRLSEELKDSVAGQRDNRKCRLLAGKIKAAAKHTKDAEQKRKWAQGLSKIISGREDFKPAGARRNAKPIRDACANAIKEVLGAR
jgi:hypothetical protein